MYMPDILVAIIAINNLASYVLIIYLIRRLLETPTSADYHVAESDEEDDEEQMPDYLDVSIQDHVIQREEQFHARIKKMKDDLSSDAEELHPDVHNLPHNIIHGGTQRVETSE